MTVFAVADGSGLIWSQDLPYGAPAAGEPAGKWVFAPEEVTAVDSGKVGVSGFNQFALWGDEGQ